MDFDIGGLKCFSLWNNLINLVFIGFFFVEGAIGCNWINGKEYSVFELMIIWTDGN